MLDKNDIKKIIENLRKKSTKEQLELLKEYKFNNIGTIDDEGYELLNQRIDELESK